MRAYSLSNAASVFAISWSSALVWARMRRDSASAASFLSRNAASRVQTSSWKSWMKSSSQSICLFCASRDTLPTACSRRSRASCLLSISSRLQTRRPSARHPSPRDRYCSPVADGVLPVQKVESSSVDALFAVGEFAYLLVERVVVLLLLSLELLPVLLQLLLPATTEPHHSLQPPPNERTSGGELSSSARRSRCRCPALPPRPPALGASWRGASRS